MEQSEYPDVTTEDVVYDNAWDSHLRIVRVDEDSGIIEVARSDHTLKELSFEDVFERDNPLEFVEGGA